MTIRSAFRLPVALCGLSLSSLTGCGDSTEPSRPTSVVLSATVLTLDAVGATQQLSAEVRDQSDRPMSDVPITWASSDTLVARVSSTGLVTAVANGTTQVSATAGSASGTATVTVAQVGTQLLKVSGDAQSDTVGRTLANPLVVRLLDRLGQPVSGQNVSFAIAAGNGSVDPATSLTNALGQASTVWTLGTASGTNHRVDASHPSVGSPATFTATALVGAPDSLENVQGDQQVGGVGLALGDSIVVRVLDQFGNAVPSRPILFRPAAGSGTASPDSVNTGTAGRAATRWTLGGDAGADTLRVSSPGLAGVELIYTATAVSVGPPARIEIADGDAQTGLVGFRVNIPPSVLVTDTLGIPTPNAEVTFQVTGGGGSLTGGTTQSDASGIATVGSWTLGSTPGQNTLDATATGVGTVTITATGAVAAYDIEVAFLTAVTASQQQAFLDAADRWGVLIFGDLAEAFVPAGFCGPNVPPSDVTVDDLLILAAIDSIDGPGNVLGQAGPCAVRESGRLPVLGVMFFDSADVRDLEIAGHFDEVILHEMGHVIGLGTLWPDQGLLTGAGGTDPHFTGPRAIQAFDRIGGAGYTGGEKVPVENTGGAGTRDAHWRESVFSTELMTGFLNAGQPNPLSEVTTASFWDMGYLVNLDGSDSFALLRALRAGAGVGEIRLVDDILHRPIYVVDSDGRVVDVLQNR